MVLIRRVGEESDYDEVLVGGGVRPVGWLRLRESVLGSAGWRQGTLRLERLF